MRYMYDSVTASDIPSQADMVAGYVDGLYAWKAEDWARFPNAVKVGIAVSANTNAGQVLDVEQGDASPSDAVPWVMRRRAAGADPTVYCSESAVAEVQAAFGAAGIPEPHYWVANWDAVAEVPAYAVAKQYADSAMTGAHYDASAVVDYWPGVDGAQAPPPVTSPASSATTYTVQAGDTLSAIAAAHGLTLDGLLSFGGNRARFPNPDLIYPGQSVDVPSADGGSPAPSSATYTVQAGDTLSAIAAAHGLTLDGLLSFGGNRARFPNPDLIYPGQSVDVPA